ncbi:DUF192 domain-containing protein [Halorhodospira halochloris]|uniref:DUF192 domain-containing protein n=1 Tax=Halorhodospira halochloris TaxID=1052 RepID=UPI001EE8A3F1|nr:DUF192 domain-containing protein [Halorhodospira halochloris]MCG5529785.1 DUF192 domain-containing protein [Halorhodospira halochloris]
MALLTVPLLAGMGLHPQRDSLEQMPQGQLLIDGQQAGARIAKTPEHMAQGFQGASSEQLATEKIYFYWGDSSRPSFHMRNVSEPLAIAWIDAADEVIAVDIMVPQESGYKPPKPVVAALEMAPERAQSWGIRPGSVIEKESNQRDQR